MSRELNDVLGDLPDDRRDRIKQRTEQLSQEERDSVKRGSFEAFIESIEEEARTEGPQAIKELRAFDTYFKERHREHLAHRKSIKHRVVQFVAYRLHRLACWVGSVEVVCVSCGSNLIRADQNQCDKCLLSDSVDRF